MERKVNSHEAGGIRGYKRPWQEPRLAATPAERFVTTLADAELDAWVQAVRAAVNSVPVQAYSGQDVPPQAR